MLDETVALFEKGKPTHETMCAAFGLWIGYPSLLETIGLNARIYGPMPDSVTLNTPDESAETKSIRWDAYYALNHAHSLATHFLMAQAERNGLDPHPLYECGQLLIELYAHEPWKYYAGLYDTWPECMGIARYSLPACQQDVLRAGQAVFVRLAVKLGLADKEDMAEVVRNVKPHHRPPVYDPAKDAKLFADWQATQATAHKPSMKEFEEVRGLEAGELTKIIDRHRSRQRRDQRRKSPE
jgi:hypothetical protein